MYKEVLHYKEVSELIYAYEIAASFIKIISVERCGWIWKKRITQNAGSSCFAKSFHSDSSSVFRFKKVFFDSKKSFASTVLKVHFSAGKRKPSESSIFYVDNDGGSWPRNSLCITWSNGETTTTTWLWNSLSFHMELNCVSKWTKWTYYILRIFINSDTDIDINNDDNIFSVDMVVLWARAPFTCYKASPSGRNWTDSITTLKTLYVWIRIVLNVYYR